MLTRVVQYTLLCPVLDDHGQGPNALIYLDVRLDHARVLQGERVVHVHVAREFEHRVPYFHDPDLGLWHTYNSLHAVYEGQMSTYMGYFAVTYV